MTRKKSEQYNLGKETELIEYKKTIGEKKEAVISACAMLNKQGQGMVYFGVKNDGTVIGHETGANTMRDVGRAITDHIKPVVYPKVETETYGNKEVIKVSFDGTRQPYLAYGKPYIRVSDEDKQMDQEMYDDLLRSRDNKNKAWRILGSASQGIAV
ncbi:MAG: ATP-binding protein [Lachnospiraceae bacterium]|nr:ATP-binding protein [Lachnospiraceae bacterium]